MAKAYTPLLIKNITISLGLFDTRKNAEKVFLEYIKQNPGFTECLGKMKVMYTKEYNRGFIFDYSIFNEHDNDEFWQENELLFFTIEEVEIRKLWEFYGWTDWDNDNLYTLLNCILTNTRFVADIHYLSYNNPIIP